MVPGARLSHQKSGSWFVKTRERLYPYRPRFRDRHFWVIQGSVIAIVALHYLTELDLFAPDLESSLFIPVTLFFIPVMYAALKFGFIGSVATAAWATVVTIPNIVLFHHGLAVLGETFQLLIVNAAAVFLGYWVGRERMARQLANAYAAHVIKAQEEERQRIARDLHDECIQTLVLLCQDLDAIRSSRSLSSTIMEKLQKARKTAENASTGLRNFTRELRPPILDDLGMVAAIRRLMMDHMDWDGIKGEFKVRGNEHRLPPELEVGLFRIAQEALSNVGHHARATSVAINITFTGKEVSLDIRDNGQGFVVPIRSDNVVASGKLGLVGMWERAEIMGGRLDVQSSPGKGTRINVSIPLKNRGPK
jgi:two-component system sensor histidine kinase DegS